MFRVKKFKKGDKVRFADSSGNMQNATVVKVKGSRIFADQQDVFLEDDEGYARGWHNGWKVEDR